MAQFKKLAYDSAGFDGDRDDFVMGQNSAAVFYLIGAPGYRVEIEDGTVVTVASKDADDAAGHKAMHAAKADYVRKVVLRTGSATGKANLVAYNDNGYIAAGPITVYVVDNKENRRITDKAMDAEMRAELDGLSLREAVIRIAEDQVHSNLIADKGGAKGAARYHLNPSYGTLWCGKFAHWCWQRACDVKKVSNPFGASGETFLSPQKAISWGMRSDTRGQLLQYAGPDPMGHVKGRQELREIGWSGNDLEPGDLALWRNKATGAFQHVSFVKSFDGTTLVDINGNAYDAESGSAFDIITHPSVKEKVKGDYRCFFLHVQL